MLAESAAPVFMLKIIHIIVSIDRNRNLGGLEEPLSSRNYATR